MGLTKPRAYQIYDIDYKQAVRVVTTSNITLSGGAPSLVDGVTLSLNDRVLVTGQSTGSQNGLYYVTTVGTGANGTWARSVDGNETGEILAGMIVMVTEGTTYADTQWKLTTNDPITVGSTSLTFVLNVQANSISSGTSNVVVNSNANVTISSAGTANVFTVSSTGTVTSGTASVTGNINSNGAVNINSTDGNYNVLNISGTALAPYGTPQTWKFFTNNTALGGAASFILFPDSSTQTTAYPGTASALSLSANITGGNLISNAQVTSSGNITGGNLRTAGLASVTGNVTGGNITTAGQVTATANITGGNILTVGQISSTGTITTAAGTNSTGFAVGNGAVSNVGLGFFPTAGTRGDYAIRDYSSVFSTMYLDVGMGGSAGGEFQFRTGNTYSLSMRANSSGVYSSGVVSATGTVYGSELNSTNSQANEGGQINLALPSSGSTLSTSVIIDVYQNKVRFFEGGGTARGAYIDLTSCSAGAATNLLAGGGGGGTPGGSNTYVQFNDGGTFGGNGQFTYDKVTNTLTAGIIAANNNGTGQNFKVGDDAWIGDINAADTFRVTGQQNGANAYIVFGNADGVALGRAGTGPLTYGGAFSATGNITGGNVLGGANVNATTHTGTTVSVTANITGGNLISSGIISATGRTFVASGNAAAPGITFLSDTGQDTGFYWISDGNIGVSTNGTLRSSFFDTGFSVVGTITGGNLATAGTISATGNITGGNVLGGANVNATTHTGATVSVTGNITGGNILTGGLISATGTITGSTFSGAGTNLTGTASSLTVGTATVAGTVTTAAQPNITSVGTLSSLTVTANVAGGNILTGGLISATGTITGSTFSGAGTNLTGTASSLTVGTATVAGTVTTAAQPNITSVGTLSSLSVTGNVTAGGHVGTIYTNSIINTGANATGNIGSSSLYFNTAFVKATSAQYADLAEMYVADFDYSPGTVVEFGGEYEITQTTQSCSTAIAGIISTNPSYLMNSCQSGEYVLPVALTGRVPCYVQGPVKKGDVLISSNIPGVAQRIGANWQPGCTVGKAMETVIEPVIQIIEVAVGRL